MSAVENKDIKECDNKEKLTYVKTKRCAKCGEWKPLDSFGLFSSTKSKIHPRCKECVKMVNKLFYEKNREKAKEKRMLAKKVIEEKPEKIELRKEREEAKKATDPIEKMKHKARILEIRARMLSEKAEKKANKIKDEQKLN